MKPAFLSLLVLALASAPAVAHAFPGFVVGTTAGPVTIPSATVVLVRHDTLTAMTVVPEVDGATGEIALVLAVGTGAEADHARMIPREVVERLELVSAPHLVERWERDPCATSTREGVTGIVLPGESTWHGGRAGSGAGYGAGAGRGAGGGDDPPAELAERLTAGDYVVEVFVAELPSDLATFLADRGFVPPPELASMDPFGAPATFLVARIAPPALALDGTRASLPPLRIEYHEDALVLRSGLAAALGLETDLVVQALASHRIGATTEILAPTALDVSAGAEPGALHAAVFARLSSLHPASFVVEHAWVASGCEGCAGGHSVRARDLATLGAQLVFTGGVSNPGPYHTCMTGLCGGREGRSVPRIDVGTPDVRGALTPAVVRRVVDRHVNEVRFCYEQELALSEDIAGRVTTRFVVSPTGAVQTASVAASTLANARVETCIATAVRRWSFPAPAGGGIAMVDLAFTLHASGGGPGPRTELRDWVLSRLHVHAGPGVGDVTLEERDPIEGGREHGAAAGEAAAEAAAEPVATTDDTGAHARRNRFQVRYVVRHPWEGELACEAPVRDVWGAPMHEAAPDPIAAARGAAPLSDEALDAALVASLGELGLARPAPVTEPVVEPTPEPTTTTSTTVAPATVAEPASGCGCRASRSSGSGWLGALLVAALVWRQRSYAQRKPTCIHAPPRSAS